MNASLGLTVGLAAAGVAALAGAWACARLRGWQRKSPGELERIRRLDVNRKGRITSGRIVDLPEPGLPDLTTRLVIYQYEVAGVRYEAAQDLSALPGMASAVRGPAGQTISIKYDSKKPANSIIACEDWCGVPDIKSGAESA